ncbi:MAG: hypothetical protein H0T76_20255 [Nannocystis sp.]|nr:hypothetical protein [Nannocystis sp.]MBA3548822.1 hypothetical protein [Nannocystis sp.]
MPPKEIVFTPAKIVALRTAHDAAVTGGQEQFKFEGHDVLTDYARYLLEYLKNRQAGR